MALLQGPRGVEFQSGAGASGTFAPPLRAPCSGWTSRRAVQIFCEANQLMELVPGLEFNDFELFTMSERLVLFCFDLSFVWIAVVLGHMKGIREAGEPPESDGSGGLIYPESACKVNDGCARLPVPAPARAPALTRRWPRSIGQQMTSLFDKSGKDHSAIVFVPGFARDGMDFPGGYIFLDILMCLLMNFAVGKTPMEHIMIDALPELPKFDPFYWTNSVSVFGCCLGTYPWVLATTCFDNCCAKDDNCLGNGATSTRNACFVYCFGFIGVAVLMFFYVLGEATGCVLSYILELVVRSALSRSARPKRSPRAAALRTVPHDFGVDHPPAL